MDPKYLHNLKFVKKNSKKTVTVPSHPHIQKGKKGEAKPATKVEKPKQTKPQTQAPKKTDQKKPAAPKEGTKKGAEKK
jgi:hypothetical protein